MELPTMDASEWAGRARREASAILNNTTPHIGTRSDMLPWLAVAWLQGFNLGVHETLGEAEKAFQRLQEDLTA